MGVAFRELPGGRSRWRLPQSRDRGLQGSTHCGYCVHGSHLLPMDHDPRDAITPATRSATGIMPVAVSLSNAPPTATPSSVMSRLMWQRRTLSDPQSGGYLRARHPVQPRSVISVRLECPWRINRSQRLGRPMSSPVGTPVGVVAFGPPSAHAERRTSTPGPLARCPPVGGSFSSDPRSEPRGLVSQHEALQRLRREGGRLPKVDGLVTGTADHEGFPAHLGHELRPPGLRPSRPGEVGELADL
jgi:hypothetical protein